MWRASDKTTLLAAVQEQDFGHVGHRAVFRFGSLNEHLPYFGAHAKA